MKTVQMTQGQYQRKRAYHIDPLMAASVEIIEPEFFHRHNGEIDADDLAKEEKRKRSVLGIIAALVLFLLIVPYSQVTQTSVDAAPNSATVSPGDADMQVAKVQLTLKSMGYSLVVDGVYGPQTGKAIRHFQKANGLYVDGIVGPRTAAILFATGAAATQPAKRLNQYGLNGLPFAPAGLDACAEMVYYMRQAGLPERFGDGGRHQRWTRSDGLGWRESKCRNDVTSSTGCCVGYWQNYISSHLSRMSAYRPRIINECKVDERSDILGTSALAKQKQACVTKVVYDISGLAPWN